MGTNFYLESTARLPAAFARTRIHIGKSSAGWCFALHVYPHCLCDYEPSKVDHCKPSNLGQWLGLAEATTKAGTARIVDEYGSVISLQEMEERITNRSWANGSWSERPVPWMYDSWVDFHHQNHSEPGPAGLLRHKVDGMYCIAHGEGTWDLVVGDFE